MNINCPCPEKLTIAFLKFVFSPFFCRIYDAAKALEECDTKYRAVLAKPKEKREQHNYPKPPSRDYNERHDRPSNSRHGNSIVQQIEKF